MQASYQLSPLHRSRVLSTHTQKEFIYKAHYGTQKVIQRPLWNRTKNKIE